MNTPTSIEGLPKSWARATIGDLIGRGGVFIDGDWVETKDQDQAGDVRLIQLADVGDGAYLNRSARFLTSGKAAELGCTYLQRGDVLIARMPEPLGRACLFPSDPKRAVTVVDVCIVRTGENGPYHRWIVWALNSPQFRTAVASLQSGSTRARISRGNLATLYLNVPPLAEQLRIADEVEKQFTRLDAAVAALKRVQANLKRYRTAVLKAACEGRLVPTEAELARREGRPYEPASELLKRILAERRARWEGSRKVKYQGQQRKGEWRGANYKEPLALDTGVLRELPDGWNYVASDALFIFVTSGSRGWAKYYSDGGALFIRIGNLNHESIELDLRHIQRVKPPPGSEGTRTKILPSDILISITADLGMIALVPENFEEAYINQHIALARPVHEVVVAYVAWYLATREGGGKHFERLRRGATKLGLGLDDIRSVPFPLPPLEEQKRIIAEIERRFSVIDKLEIQVRTSLIRAERLRHSILKRAFEGKLVPQDPSDEPASVLLERIRAERAALVSVASKTRAKRGKGVREYVS